MDVFKAPSGLAEELIEFFELQTCHQLTGLDNKRSVIEEYIGVYALYYTGDYSLYKDIGQANRNDCCLPIYVGKAVPKGTRTGQAEQEGRTTASNNLYKRLNEHKRSIDQVENLSLDLFQFRIVAMEINLVTWGEVVLISHFQPAWNQVISGFGIHDPGSGRAQQQRSVWDRLHPGRTAARRLPVADPINEVLYRQRLEELYSRMSKQLGFA